MRSGAESPTHVEFVEEVRAADDGKRGGVRKDEQFFEPDSQEGRAIVIGQTDPADSSVRHYPTRLEEHRVPIFVQSTR